MGKMKGKVSEKPISALHVGKYFPPFSGGMENFLSDLLRVLSNRGVNVSAVVHAHRTGTENPAIGWPGDDLYYEPGALSHGNGGSVPIYRVPSWGRVLYAPVSPQFRLYLRKAIKAERPDILHMQVPNTSAFWALCVPEALSIPWVVHWQSDVVSSSIDRRLKWAYPMYRPFEQRLLRKADSVIVTSPGYLDGSAALAPWRAKCRTIPLGLDPERIPKTSDDDRQQADKWWGGFNYRVISVGRLTYYKGHEYLIRAVSELPEARAVIVGEGERRTVLEKLISSLGLEHRVKLTGKLSPPELYALIETCDCMCLPSIERTEAFGIVLLEAMAHGKAAVVCDVRGSGMSWVVQDGKTGLVVPPADPGALSSALRSLSADRETLTRMGAAARYRYQEVFSMDRVGSEMQKVYKEILSDTR